MSAKSRLGAGVEIGERSRTILRIIVEDYIATVSPVSSESLVRRHGLPVSPATVRHEMTHLEEGGYITRPHTSAGGMPSDKGYRFYVESLPQEAGLPPEREAALREPFASVRRDVEAWTHLATVLLAQLAGNLAVVSAPRSTQIRLKHLELVHLQEFLGLLILVLQGARLIKELLPFETPVSPEELQETRNKLNTLYSGLSLQEIAAKRAELTPLEERLVSTAIHLLRMEEQEYLGDHYVEGLGLLLEQPEFAEGTWLRGVASILEEPEVLRTLLGAGLAERGLQVIIGAEHQTQELRPFSVVLVQYGVPGEMSGVASVIGPTRMPYGRTLSGLRSVAGILKELVQGVRDSG